MEGDRMEYQEALKRGVEAKNHERAKLEGTFQEQTGTGGLVQRQPALLQEKDP